MPGPGVPLERHVRGRLDGVLLAVFELHVFVSTRLLLEQLFAKLLGRVAEL
jgi:hypothetical protein